MSKCKPTKHRMLRPDERPDRAKGDEYLDPVSGDWVPTLGNGEVSAWLLSHPFKVRYRRPVVKQ